MGPSLKHRKDRSDGNIQQSIGTAHTALETLIEKLPEHRGRESGIAACLHILPGPKLPALLGEHTAVFFLSVLEGTFQTLARGPEWASAQSLPRKVLKIHRHLKIFQTEGKSKRLNCQALRKVRLKMTRFICQIGQYVNFPS